MGNINRKRRVLTSPSTGGSGGGTDPADKTRITNLENNEYKIVYWEAVNTNSGTITKPTNSTILLDSFQQGIDAVVETIVGGQPSGLSPITAAGAYVTISSFDTAGNFTLSGVPTAYPVAIVYIIKIKTVDYVNINTSFILASEPVNYEMLNNKDVSGGYVGLTALKINFKNVLNTFTSFFTNSNTAPRTYAYPDKDITVAGIDDIQNGIILYASSSGTDTYTATLTPSITAYFAGQKFSIKINNSNTGSSTLNLNSLGAKTIVKLGNQALIANDLIAGGVYDFVYDGTNFQVTPKLGIWYDWTPSVTGYSVAPTITSARYCVIGKTLILNLRMSVGGTSNSGSHGFALPLGLLANKIQYGICITINNITPTQGYIQTADNSNTVMAVRDGSGTAWGTGVPNIFQICNSVIEIN